MKQRELLTVDETREPPIMRARRRLEKADAEFREADDLFENQGIEASEQWEKAYNEQRQAERWLRKLEAKELAALRCAADEIMKHQACGGIVVRGEPFWKLKQ